MPDILPWVRISTYTPDDEKVRIIMAMPDGDALFVIWILLIIQAGKCNMGGRVALSDEIPFTDESLATVLQKPLNTVRLAIETFKKLGMVEFDDGFLFLPNFAKNQNIDRLDQIRELNRERQKRFREKTSLKLLPQNSEAVTLQSRFTSVTLLLSLCFSLYFLTLALLLSDKN